MLVLEEGCGVLESYETDRVWSEALFADRQTDRQTDRCKVRSGSGEIER